MGTYKDINKQKLSLKKLMKPPSSDFPDGVYIVELTFFVEPMMNGHSLHYYMKKKINIKIDANPLRKETHLMCFEFVNGHAKVKYSLTGLYSDPITIDKEENDFIIRNIKKKCKIAIIH